MNYFRTLVSEKTKRIFYDFIVSNSAFRPIWGVVILVAFVGLLAYPLLGFAEEVFVFLLLLYGTFLIVRKGWRKSRYRKDIRESNKGVRISETRISDPPQIRR